MTAITRMERRLWLVFFFYHRRQNILLLLYVENTTVRPQTAVLSAPSSVF